MLTKTHILSFKDAQVYKNPTEVIIISSCSTVKSVEEEINKPNAFVSILKEVFLILKFLWIR